MLNTLIHNRNIKPSDRMSFAKFLMQTKGIDNDQDIDRDYLHAIYERVRSNEFKANADHVNIVLDFERSLVGLKKPSYQLAQPHRRLICYVQLFEINDLAKKERLNTHQRDIFLFNDLLVVIYF
jgi:IQ motif/SEC7 domain-containing protein